MERSSPNRPRGNQNDASSAFNRYGFLESADAAAIVLGASSTLLRAADAVPSTSELPPVHVWIDVAESPNVKPNT
jgi:hypothetical protein